MDKLQKHDYMNNIEGYLEQNQVYELFADLLKRLVVARPDKPLDFIQDALSKPRARSVFLMGAPGTEKREIAKELSDRLHWRSISVSDLLKTEVEKASDDGKRIAECQKAFKLVDDDIVIKLVKAEVQKCEAANESFFVDGYPRTKVQALSMQQLRIVPDKLIHLNVRKQKAVQSIMNKVGQTSALMGNEMEELAQQLYSEYTMNINAVRDSFKQFIFEYDTENEGKERTYFDLTEMLHLRYRSGAPRRPPRVILVGPTGSGRTTQAAALSEAFGLVHINPSALIKVEAEKNPGIKPKIKEAMEEGVPIPDEIMLRLIDNRLRQSDCRVNGWVLDGFPQNQAQVNLLKSMKVNPSHVIMFEQAQDESIRRLSNRRLDPRTGLVYNVEVDPPKNETILMALIKRQEDSEPIVRKRYMEFQQNMSMLEESFKSVLKPVASDKTVESVRMEIFSTVQNEVK